MMLIAVAMSSETGLTTMQAVICFVDLVNHHTRAGTVGQFNSGNVSAPPCGSLIKV